MRGYLILGLTLMGTSYHGAAQWVPSGLDGLTVHAFASDDSALYAGTETHGVYRSTDDGASWVAVSSGLTTPHVRSLVFSDTNLLAGTWGGGVCRSTDNGASWTPVDSGLTDAWVNVLVVAPNATGGTNLYAGTYFGGLFLSTNQGSTWARIGPQFGCIASLAVLDTNIFVGTYDFLSVSSDGGTTWQWRGFSTIFNVDDFAVIGTTVLAASSSVGGYGGVYRSDDGFRTWQRSGYDETFCLAIAGTHLFAGTAFRGIAVSTDSGKAWSAISTGLRDSLVIWELAVKGENLFAGTWLGVWRRPLSEMTTSVGPVTPDVPRVIALSQNYPNPFNPTTTVEYALPQAGYATVRIYDLLGNEVATLADGERPAGTFSARWDATGLPSGVYFCRLAAGGVVHIKKMVLTK